MGGFVSRPGANPATKYESPQQVLMKAAIYTNYGPPEVVQVKEVAKPSPKAKEVLIKIHAATVASGDTRMRGLRLPTGFGPFGRLMFGIFHPRDPILGTDLAGEIESVGTLVTKFKPGDKVFATTGMSAGCHAEYRCMEEDAAIALIPSNISYEDAAAIPFGGMTALTFLRGKANIQTRENVLIIGASGAVGSAAVQLAKSFGAKVTGVCSTANIELVRSIGADTVIDYTKEDFTKNGEMYDIVLDSIGIASFFNCKNSLSAKGRLLLVAAGLPEMLSIPWISLTSSKKVMAGPASENAEDMRFLADLAESRKFKAVIGQRFPLERISEAHALVDTGHKIGNVLITMV